MRPYFKFPTCFCFVLTNLIEFMVGKQILILASDTIHVSLRRHISGQFSKHLLNETFLIRQE